MADHPEQFPLELPTEIAEQFVHNQTKELELKIEELTLKKQEDSNGFEFGKIALEAKTQDRKECREHERAKGKDKYVFLGVVAFVVTIIIISAMITDNSEIAKDIIKAVVFVTAGAIGGFGMAKKKNVTPEDDSK